MLFCVTFLLQLPLLQTSVDLFSRLAMDLCSYLKHTAEPLLYCEWGGGGQEMTEFKFVCRKGFLPEVLWCKMPATSNTFVQ
jgi:hypothetical protein